MSDSDDSDLELKDDPPDEAEADNVISIEKVLAARGAPKPKPKPASTASAKPSPAQGVSVRDYLEFEYYGTKAKGCVMSVNTSVEPPQYEVLVVTSDRIGALITIDVANINHNLGRAGNDRFWKKLVDSYINNHHIPRSQGLKSE